MARYLLAFIFSMLAFVALPSLSFATCGMAFEACFDGVDNDCDGATDEGCAACYFFTLPTVAFPFDWRTELRADPDSKMIPLNDARLYGNFMDTNWKLLLSHRIVGFRLQFSGFNTENGFDFLKIDTELLQGNLGAFSTDFIFPTSVGTPVDMRWKTDSSINSLGFFISTLQAVCGSETTVTFKPVPINTGIDGVMLNAKDDAYASFTVPANRQAWVNIDVMGGGAMDIDLFATDVTAGPKPFAWNPGSSDFFEDGGTTTGELLFIPASAASRQIQLHLRGWSGSGRYRMFIASPVANSGETIEIAYEENLTFGGALDVLGRNAYRAARGWMLAATDGQYPISCGLGVGSCTDVEIEKDLGDWGACWSCRDIIFMDENLAGCEPAKMTIGPSGSYIEISKQFWAGVAGACPVVTSDRVGMTIVHEWGHKEFDITPDEREEFGTKRIECSHSLMAGSTASGCNLGGVCYFEFCSDDNHFVDPEGSASGTLPIFSNWFHLTDEHAALTPPPTGKTPDFSQLLTLRQRMGQFTVFSEL